MSEIKTFNECFNNFITALYEPKETAILCHVCGVAITEEMDDFSIRDYGNGYRYYCGKEHYEQEVGECEVCGNTYLLEDGGDGCCQEHLPRQRKTFEEEQYGL